MWFLRSNGRISRPITGTIRPYRTGASTARFEAVIVSEKMVILMATTLASGNGHCESPRRESIVLAVGQVTLRLNEIFLG